MENKIVDILKVKYSITRRVFTNNISKLNNIKEITLIKSTLLRKKRKSISTNTIVESIVLENQIQYQNRDSKSIPIISNLHHQSNIIVQINHYPNSNISNNHCSQNSTKNVSNRNEITPQLIKLSKIPVKASSFYFYLSC